MKTNTASIKRTHMVYIEGPKRTMGKPKGAWIKVVREDLGTYGLTKDIALE